MTDYLVPTEDSEQAALFQWAILREQYIPVLRLLFAIPNGGYRHPATAARMKKTGLKAGVPDVFLPVAHGGWHGIFVEMKRRKGGAISTDQKAWHNRLTEQGYCVKVCKGWEDAAKVITEYLGVQ